MLYHNHNCEFRKVGAGKCAYDVLIEKTNPEYVNFEFDSCWATEVGVDTIALMERLGERMKLYHINDRGTRMSGPGGQILKSDSMELGYGNETYIFRLAPRDAGGPGEAPAHGFEAYPKRCCF